jgi:hypothetical protein
MKGRFVFNDLRYNFAVRLLLLPALLFPFAVPAVAQSPAEDAPRVIRLMQEDNYTFRDTDSPTVWTIHFAGAHLKDIKVVVAIGNGPDTTLVVFATLVEKRRMPATADFMRNLLEQNHKLERVKIGLDKDGDLEVDIDAKLRVTDAQELKEIVSQVRDVSDSLYGSIEPQLTQ